MVVQHHAPELEGLHVVLVEQQGLLKALGGRFEIAQFSRDFAAVRDTVPALQ